MEISYGKKIASASVPQSVLVPIADKNIQFLRFIAGKKFYSEIQNILNLDYFRYEEKEVQGFAAEINGTKTKIYLISIPKEQDKIRKYAEIGSALAEILKKDKISSCSLVAFEDVYGEKRDFIYTESFLEGFMFGLYEFNKFKTEKEDFIFSGIEIITSMLKLQRFIEERAKKLNIIFENINLARDMINTPANYMTPQIFSDIVSEKSINNIKVTILNGKEIKEKGLNLIDAVGKGSSNEARFIVLEYKGNPNSFHNIALVGKGITFDSGGTNLKPSGSLETMKTDMSGAASVFAVTRIAAALGLKVNINAYIPLAENIIGGSALKPGDVVAAASGKTVEIMNTDAEGRLILADALFKASESEPEVIIDMATLTGGCVVALGPYCAGFFTNSKSLSKNIYDISAETSEDVWELPLFEYYEEGIKSDVADIQNMSSFKREGAAIHAALFLQQFIGNNSWIHFDIAGTAFLEKKHPIYGKGASGFGIRLLLKLIEKHFCDKN